MTDEEGAVRAAPKYPNIKYVPEYIGHWNGEAWFSGHPYGLQVHRSLGDAERWVEGRRAIGAEHSEDCMVCCAAVDGRHLYYPPGTPETKGPYLAANGHSMIARVTGYNRDGSLAYEQHSAWCAPDCGACKEGYSLPDW